MKVSRIISLSLRLLLIVLISTPFMLLLLSLQTSRTVSIAEPLSSADLNAVEQLLLDSAPSSTARASEQALSVSADQLNLLLRYGLQVMRLSPAWSGQAELSENQLDLKLSLAVAGQQVPLFFNISGVLTELNGGLQLSSLRVGNLALPPSLTNYIVSRLENNLIAADVGFEDYRELLSNIDRVQIQTDTMTLVMQWEPDLIDRIANNTRQMFIPEADRVRIIEHYEQIRRIVATIPTDLRAVSLNTFLVPLFNFANEQSIAGNDPVAENRAALQALAVYVNDEDITQLVGTELAPSIEPIEFIEVRLQRRQDLAQHLVSIAALSSSAGAGVAQLLSTTKEAYDARYRTGFSFSDLTANTVGVTLATFATRDRESALIMQTRLAAIENESDYMPIVGNNRDGLSEYDFVQLYQDRNSTEYSNRLREIEELILSRPLFQGLQ